MDETITLIKSLTEELLQKLGLEVTVAVSQVDETVVVQLETEDPGILIGYHGRNLESLQLLLGQMVYRKLGSWVRISVSVGDYRDRREKQLKEMATQAAEQALQDNEPVMMPYLSPAERRIVHMTLQENDQVTSESEGEGRNRRLIIKPKA